jgi:murein DD-endopeptidase MepM/ murein hydrolase activator NlpD
METYTNRSKDLAMDEFSTLPRSGFSDCLIRENGLGRQQFERWLFYPGMLFEAATEWWGDQAARNRPHEGLDICLYQNRRNQICTLDENTKIPAMFDGVVVGVIKDFLGQTIVMEHRDPGGESGARCYTFFGHIRPTEGLAPGRSVTEGEPIALLSGVRGSKRGMLPHLHLSVGLASSAVPHDRLHWRYIGTSSALALIDPLQLLTQPVAVTDKA